jgi:formylglycine-generating enzyme required for sulfatase activity
MKKIAIYLMFSFAISTISFANNLILGTPTISGSTLSFTIKWDNSWKVTDGPANWDAVWIFVKRQTCVAGTVNPWIHATLDASGQSVTGTELQVDNVTDNAGVFVRRSTNGIGNITQATVTLTLASAIGGDNIRVFGMEMVNVPTGDFYIGDGGYSQSGNTVFGNSTNQPVQITSATTSLTKAQYGNQNQYGSSVTLPSTYPFGYNRFYCMKYEITSAQYLGFLNSLTYDQQLHKQQDMNWNTTPPTSAAGTVFFNYANVKIKIKTPGISTTSLTPAVYACDANNNGVYDEDCDGLGFPIPLRQEHWLTYLEWAALRPMTEFEYEKACRGPLIPVLGEKAWGTEDIAQFQYISTTYGCSSETQTYFALGLCNYQTGRMHRAGSAASSITDRVHAGATYYGILDMTGSTYERCVGGWNYDYSTYTTANGDGNINSNGSCGMTIWNNMQYMNRGGSAQNGQSIQVSVRNYNNDPGYGNINAGRGVRSF